MKELICKRFKTQGYRNCLADCDIYLIADRKFERGYVKLSWNRYLSRFVVCVGYNGLVFWNALCSTAE